MFWLRLAAIVWLLGIAAGMSVLLRHQGTPGAEARFQRQWPKQAGTRDLHRPTLLIFAHAQCPCTRATLGELNRLLSKCSDRPGTHVFFIEPPGVPASWVETGSWREASSIPGVQVHRDREGEKSRLFGAITSGTAMLYGLDGRLLFCGGITPGRGHAGDNAGTDSILRLLKSGRAAGEVASVPVFGCELFHGCEQEVICAK